MGLVELFLLALGLSMDTFAVGITAGLTMKRATFKKMLIMGLYFGVFQAGMPVIGYLLAVRFSCYVVAFSPWIAFGLLAFLGGKMLVGSLKEKKESLEPKETMEISLGAKELIETPLCSKEIVETSLGPRVMLPLAVATSIDALAVGVSFAFLQVDIIFSVTLIGVVTLVVSMMGVKIGHLCGLRYKSKAEILGGLILIGIGLNILMGHLLS